MKHWRRFFEDKYLGAWVMDEAGRDLTVEIDKIQLEKLKNPDTNTEENKLIIYFAGKQKGMVCNKTNAKRIAALYGDDTAAWTGKRITLYPTTVNAFGKDHRCIRVREQRPQTDAAPQGQETQPKMSDRLRGMAPEGGNNE